MEESDSNDIVDLLRMRACPPEGEYSESDHGHSDCYLEREAADEIERLRRPSWDDLMAIVDEIYPADVFDGSSGDEGPRTLTLMREIERLRLELAESARNVISQMAVEDELRFLIVYWCDVVDDLDGHPSDYHSNVAAAEDELRKAVGR